MSSFKVKQIIAAAISPFDKAKIVPPGALMASFISLVVEAYGIDDIMKPSFLKGRCSGLLLVEGQQELIDLGGVKICIVPVETIGEMQESYRKGEFSSLDSFPEEGVVIMALGGPTFCQEAVRFAHMDREGNIDSRANAFIAGIEHLEPGGVLWHDAKVENGLHEGDLVQMFFKAKQLGAIPD